MAHRLQRTNHQVWAKCTFSPTQLYIFNRLKHTYFCFNKQSVNVDCRLALGIKKNLCNVKSHCTIVFFLQVVECRLKSCRVFFEWGLSWSVLRFIYGRPIDWISGPWGACPIPLTRIYFTCYDRLFCELFLSMSV